MTMDKMILHGLRCTAHIGCKPDERALPQALLTSIRHAKSPSLV